MSGYQQECKEKEVIQQLMENDYKIITVQECLNGTRVRMKHETTNEMTELILETPGARKYFLKYV